MKTKMKYTNKEQDSHDIMISKKFIKVNGEFYKIVAMLTLIKVTLF